MEIILLRLGRTASQLRIDGLAGIGQGCAMERTGIGCAFFPITVEPVRGLLAVFLRIAGEPKCMIPMLVIVAAPFVPVTPTGGAQRCLVLPQVDGTPVIDIKPYMPSVDTPHGQSE